MKKILIADDHAILRRGLKEILVTEFGEITCGEAENAQQILAQIRKKHWDLLILDIDLPGRSGLDVLRELKSQSSRIPVLVLSMHPEDQFGKRVLQAGAAGYMNKECIPGELFKAIRKILGGSQYLSPALAEKLAMELVATGGRPVREVLSDREFEVLRLLALGHNTPQIADELNLAATTICTYRARIHKKTGTRTSAELMHYAMSNHMVE